MSEQRNEKFYWLKLKKNIAKSGKVYWTGNFSYAIDLIGFEKDDGTMTVWFSPKDMDQMKQAGKPPHQQQNALPKARPPAPQPRYAPEAPPPYAEAPPPYEPGDPGPSDDDLPF